MSTCCDWLAGPQLPDFADYIISMPQADMIVLGIFNSPYGQDEA
jgi:hypothetical protein